MAWLIPFEDLTLPQQQAVEADDNQSQLLIGGPGAGKTVVLAHRLKRLLDGGNDAHLFSYTNSVAQYLRSDLEGLGIATHVTTIDSWAMHWFKEHINDKVPTKPLPRRRRSTKKVRRQKVRARRAHQEREEPDFDAIIAAVTDHVRQSDTYLYHHVLMDEGQDLDGLRLGLLKELTDAFTIAADDKQLLFTDGSQLRLLESELRLMNHSLLATYRCCEFISRIAARFLTGQHAAEFIAQTQGCSDNARQVAWKATDDYHEELDALAQAIQDSQNQGDATLAILAPTNRAAYGLRAGLEERGVACAEFNQSRWKRQLDLRKPVILTYHSAKGLTVDAVFLPRLNAYSFSHLPTNADKMRALFVGITRATSHAWLGGPCTVSEPITAAIEAAVKAGDVFRY